MVSKRKQCKACPWKVTTDPGNDIPGHCRTQHERLENTIAEPASLAFLAGGTLRLMACHEFKSGEEMPCVGWLAHQLGPGNNIALRMKAMSDRSLYDFELDGEQHKTLKDTLGDRQ